MVNEKFKGRKRTNEQGSFTDSAKRVSRLTSEQKVATPHGQISSAQKNNPSSQLRFDLEKYSGALLYSFATKKEETIRDIAREKDVNFLKSVFFPNSFETLLENSKEEGLRKYEECVYKLFLFFSEPRFAKESYRMEVLNWLADEIEIEKIIERKDKVKMVHWLASYNDLRGIKWAFERYNKNLEVNEIRNIFQLFDEDEQDLFKYLADGIIAEENSNFNPQAEVIKIVLEEFGKTINDKKKERVEINKKKELIRSLLEGIEFTEELEEQLTVKKLPI